MMTVIRNYPFLVLEVFPPSIFHSFLVDGLIANGPLQIFLFCFVSHLDHNTNNRVFL
jgi:hypothetical protein